ncbi:uncharacterized protein CPUR_08540 [Claviceps purpurea 20.1]|uniref:FAR1 domain-containing protein n=1 Tax=Claviceps purpurea (strain 20.1) TaxID=1111077 RepID=M1W6F7_CLAP2|nr:uncharacterized protein CPUR_08540 [Claviceps purpurea 20.1]
MEHVSHSAPEPVSEPASEPAPESLRTFDLFEDALASARKTASSQGYSLAIHRRQTNSEGVESSVRLRCSKALKYVPHDTGTHPSKKRRTKTRKEACPFRLLISRDADGRWSIKPSQNLAAREHSHDPDSFGTFPADRGSILRRHSAFILAQWHARVKMHQILTGLRHIGDPDTCLVRGQDIANFIKAHERAGLGGKTSIQRATR